MKLDHVLIRVDNLEDAVKDFENCGFRVYYGNSKPNCHHAMIYFRDGSFVELIDQSKFPSFFRFLARTGVLDCFGILLQKVAHYANSEELFLDFALLSNNIDLFHEESKNRASKLTKMERKNALGDLLKWKLFAFKKYLWLPFVMSEYEPKRFPEENAVLHRVEVSGIEQMDIRVEDSAKYCDEFGKCFGVSNSSNAIALENSVIKIEESHVYEIMSITLSCNSFDQDISSQLEKYGIKLRAK